jgi:hypothetical protein
MINFLLLLTIYIWPFGQLLSFTSTTLPFTVYLLDVVVFLLFLSLLFSPKRKEMFKTPITKPLLIFLGAAVLSLLINLKQGIAVGLPLSSFYLLRLITYPSLFFAARFVGLVRLQKPLVISIVIFSFLGLLQYLVFPDMRYLKNIGFDDHYFRLIGSFYDPNFTGAVLAGIALYFVGKNRWLFSLPFVGLLALTFSRASLLVIVVGLIYLLLTQKKTKLLLLIIFLGTAVYLIPKPFGEGVNLLRTFSIFSRFGSWQEGIILYFQKPIFGWGYNNLRSVTGGRFQVDSSFIFLMATTGIIGFSSFINLIIKIQRNIKDRGINILIFSVLFHSVFNNSLFYIWILAFFWLALGLNQEKVKGYKST